VLPACNDASQTNPARNTPAPSIPVGRGEFSDLPQLEQIGTQTVGGGFAAPLLDAVKVSPAAGGGG